MTDSTFLFCEKNFKKWGCSQTTNPEDVPPNATIFTNLNQCQERCAPSVNDCQNYLKSLEGKCIDFENDNKLVECKTVKDCQRNTRVPVCNSSVIYHEYVDNVSKENGTCQYKFGTK